MRQQTRSLNEICMKNGFVNAENKTEVHLIANSQTFMVGSLSSLTHGELTHIETIAQMYFSSNEPAASIDKIVIRNSPFFGGR